MHGNRAERLVKSLERDAAVLEQNYELAALLRDREQTERETLDALQSRLDSARIELDDIQAELETLVEDLYLQWDAVE